MPCSWRLLLRVRRRATSGRCFSLMLGVRRFDADRHHNSLPQFQGTRFQRACRSTGCPGRKACTCSVWRSRSRSQVRKACSIGHAADAVVRDGRLLVGTWQHGISRGKGLEMDPEEYWRFRTDRTCGLCRMCSRLCNCWAGRRTKSAHDYGFSSSGFRTPELRPEAAPAG